MHGLQGFGALLSSKGLHLQSPVRVRLRGQRLSCQHTTACDRNKRRDTHDGG